MKYSGEYTKEISFPIGGIGSGCIGLAGNGRLRDFEIFNRPNKCSYNTYTGFVVKAEDEDSVLDVRSLNGAYQDSLMGFWGGIDGGIDRCTLAGLPCFAEHTFIGEFPIAAVQLKDPHFPGEVSLMGYNPFIPLNSRDSSIPTAIFEIAFHNPTDRTLHYTAAFNFSNPVFRGVRNVYLEDSVKKGIRFETNQYPDTAPEYGHILISTDAARTSYQEYWRRNSWYEGLEMFWHDFSQYGPLTNRTFEGWMDGDITATLAAALTLKAGESKALRFVMTWYYPNCCNYWTAGQGKPTWKNYYATLWTDASAVADYVYRNAERLYADTVRFKDALYSSTLPESVLDAVCANLSVLKSPTCLRLEDGTFYGFEGCNPKSGSCEGSCSHVWNYQYALPFLFPDLERSMRDADFTYNENENGGMVFRLALPLGSKQWHFRPAADGHLGGIIKTYREWKICGDDAWLDRHWPILKRNIEYVWSPKNPDRWDPDKTGVLWGRQHHTLDRELFGPNSWLTGYYLCALKAMAEMARYRGEPYEEYLEIFERGKQWVEKNLWNGEYFYQKIDLNDLAQLDVYENCERYYNYETGEVNFQLGEGSITEQVVAQWHANLLGLGELFNKDMVRSALQAIYRYNYKKSMKEIFNPCRIFAYADEPGVIMCEWNDSVRKPILPLPYSREVMTGFEYQAAIHMISEGLTGQGEEIIQAVRGRYDGRKRNPWNEIECGSNYAWSLSSYSALLVYSGFVFNMQRKEIGFRPVVSGDCRFFWSVNDAWGTYERQDGHEVIRILYGSLPLKRLVAQTAPRRILVDGAEVSFRLEEDTAVFETALTCRDTIRFE
ncbi:MAG: hypothetical protein J6B85_11230 [Lachnospiraceae bacterium]|nr:hypothetical protein [Lachnospiraceae bacterium]